MVDSMCGLLPYGTGICRYAFMQFFVIFDCFCLFKKNLVSINEMECSTIPACPSIVVFLNKGSMEGTNFKNLCFDVCVYMYVCMLLCMYLLLYICVGIAFADLSWEKVYIYVGEWGGEWGKQVGNMDEESQVGGCYNITFIYTNQETV